MIKKWYITLGTLVVLFLGLYFFWNKNPNVYLQPGNWVAIGDSLTYGFGTDKLNSYPQQLSNRLGIKIINEGKNGDTSLGVLTRLDSILERHSPSVVLLSIGGNDMLRGVSDKIIIENISNIIDRLRQNNVQVILIAEPRPSLKGALISLSDANFYWSIAREKKIPIIENVFSSLLSKPEYRSDMIHLNAIGYAKAADMIFNKLSKILIIN